MSLTRLSLNPANLVTRPQFLDILVLDDCDLTDEGFAQILVGLLAQKAIRSISYLNNKIGKKSVRILQDLLDQKQSGIELFEFCIHNVDGLTIDLATRLMIYLTLQTNLVNVKLSRINLNDQNIVRRLCSLISINSETLQKFDISQSYICPKFLCELADSFLLFPNFARSLNCSYLPLSSKSGSQ